MVAPFIGSLLGVLIRRLPEGRPVALVRSACEACGHPLGPAELVPVASFLALRGRCRWCAMPIAPMHLAAELAALAVAAWVLWADGPGAAAWWDCGLGWTLLALAWIDAEHGFLPDVLTLPLVLAGLAAGWTLAPETLGDAALGAAAGYLAFRGIALGYRVLRGREGLGQGDAKLLAAAGAWVGWQGLPEVALLAALAGIAVLLAGRLRGGTLAADTSLAFGPCLALAAFMVRLYGAGWLAGV